VYSLEEKGKMRKIVLVSAFVLALMLVTLVPIPARTEASPIVQSLAFDVLPVKAEFAEAVDLEASGGEVLDPTPFWVDIVDASKENILNEISSLIRKYEELQNSAKNSPVWSLLIEGYSLMNVLFPHNSKNVLDDVRRKVTPNSSGRISR
jgi:hypothetical protein